MKIFLEAKRDNNDIWNKSYTFKYFDYGDNIHETNILLDEHYKSILLKKNETLTFYVNFKKFDKIESINLF